MKTRPKDPKVWALLGRVDKDAWVETWSRPDSSPEQMQEDAGYEDALLKTAIARYANAFKSSPAHYYSGINAITLMHLYQRSHQRDDYVASAMTMAGGVRWSAACEFDEHQQFWAKATLGDLEVLSGTPETVKAAYKEAIVCAENDWFALNSTLTQLRMLNALGFRPDCVTAGIATFERALSRLKPPEGQWQPRQVLLFSGHPVDAPDRSTPRFPHDKVPLAEAAIAKALDDLGAGPDDLAFTEGASGGDLIFAEACLTRGVKLQLLQPFPEPDFIERSVAPAEGDWPSRYYAVKARLEKNARPAACRKNWANPPAILTNAATFGCFTRPWPTDRKKSASSVFGTAKAAMDLEASNTYARGQKTDRLGCLAGYPAFVVNRGRFR